MIIVQKTVNGESHTSAEWARITGLSSSTIRQRIRKLGWSAEKAITEPLENTKG